MRIALIARLFTLNLRTVGFEIYISSVQVYCYRIIAIKCNMFHLEQLFVCYGQCLLEGFDITLFL
jgi:hypothetical protein